MALILDTVIAYLGTTFTSAVDVAVFDGPNPTAVNKELFVVVGSAGEDEDGATVELVPSRMGPGSWLDETGEILCSSWAWDGGQNIPAKRAAALANAVTCMAAVHADRTMGGLLVGPFAEASGLHYFAEQTDGGALVRVSFTVKYIHTNT